MIKTIILLSVLLLAGCNPYIHGTISGNISGESIAIDGKPILSCDIPGLLQYEITYSVKCPTSSTNWSQ